MAAPSGSTRKRASIIRDLGHLRDIDTVKQTIVSTYGFQVSDAFASDFVKFVKDMVKQAGDE